MKDERATIEEMAPEYSPQRDPFHRSRMPLAEQSGNLDKASQALNSVSKHAKGTVFGGLSVAVSDNPTATALGWLGGIVGGIVASMRTRSAVGIVATSAAAAQFVETVSRRLDISLGIGSSSATNPDPTPSSSVPDAPRPNQSPLSPPSNPSGGGQADTTPPSSVPDAPRPDQSPWSQPSNPPGGGQEGTTPPSSVPDAPLPNPEPLESAAGDSRRRQQWFQQPRPGRRRLLRRRLGRSRQRGQARRSRPRRRRGGVDCAPRFHRVLQHPRHRLSPPHELGRRRRRPPGVRPRRRWADLGARGDLVRRLRRRGAHRPRGPSPLRHRRRQRAHLRRRRVEQVPGVAGP